MTKKEFNKKARHVQTHGANDRMGTHWQNLGFSDEVAETITQAWLWNNEWVVIANGETVFIDTSGKRFFIYYDEVVEIPTQDTHKPRHSVEVDIGSMYLEFETIETDTEKIEQQAIQEIIKRLKGNFDMVVRRLREE